MPRRVAPKPAKHTKSSLFRGWLIRVGGLVAFTLVICTLCNEPSPWRWVQRLQAASSATETTRTRQQPPATAKDVAVVEYTVAGLNTTFRMKQQWWHRQEDSAGARNQAIPYWEHALVLADLLTRHPDPWATAGKLAAFSPPETWSWSQAKLLVVLGAEIGLLTTSGALLGATVLTLDPSIRLLEAAKSNLHENVQVPEGQRTVALRKGLWGADIDLRTLSGGQFSAADVLVLNHGSCDSIVLGGMFMTAMSICSEHTLMLVGFQGEVCDEIRAVKKWFEMEVVDSSLLLEELVEHTNVVALKRKPRKSVPVRRQDDVKAAGHEAKPTDTGHDHNGSEN